MWIHKITGSSRGGGSSELARVGQIFLELLRSLKRTQSGYYMVLLSSRFKLKVGIPTPNSSQPYSSSHTEKVTSEAAAMASMFWSPLASEWGAEAKVGYLMAKDTAATLRTPAMKRLRSSSVVMSNTCKGNHTLISFESRGTNLGRVHSAIVVDLQHDQTVREGSDAQHVQQSCLGSAHL